MLTPPATHSSPFIRIRLAIGITLFAIGTLSLLGIVEIELGRKRLAGRYGHGESYLLPPAALLRALSFGFNELSADLTWVRTIAFFADHVGRDLDTASLNRYILTVLRLDRHFKSVYRFGGAMLMSRGARQTNEDTFAAISLLKQGHALYPDDSQLPLLIGGYYLHELQASTDAERRRWRREGADWVRRAALVGVDLPWLPNLAATIYTEQGQRDLAVQHLRELYMITPDPRTKRQIAAKLEELHDQSIGQLKKEAEQLANEYRDSDLRFVPPDLYGVILVKPLSPFALDQG